MKSQSPVVKTFHMLSRVTSQECTFWLCLGLPLTTVGTPGRVILWSPTNIALIDWLIVLASTVRVHQSICLCGCLARLQNNITSNNCSALQVYQLIPIDCAHAQSTIVLYTEDAECDQLATIVDRCWRYLVMAELELGHESLGQWLCQGRVGSRVKVIYLQTRYRDPVADRTTEW